MHMTKSVLLVLAAALGYSVATIGMKWASVSVGIGALMLLATGFTAATLSEVVMMRSTHLSVLYLLIIAVESLVVLTYAQVIGEGLSPLQMAGGAMILAGLAVVSV